MNKVAVANLSGLRQSSIYPGFVALELVFAGLVGLCLVAMGADGSAWILGGIVAGAIAFMGYRAQVDDQAQPNRTARKIGQILVGLNVGFAIAHSHLATLTSSLPILIGLALFLLTGSLIVGFGYARLEKTKLLTGMLATTPGNLGVMASIAADYGSCPSLVSLVQLMRFTVVTSTIPLFARVSDVPAAHVNLPGLLSPLLHMDSTYLIWLMLVLAVGNLAANLGSKLKIPVPALLCPIAIGAVFNSLLSSVPFLPTIDFALPTVVNLIGQILLGITIGEYWGMNPKLDKGSIVRAIVPVSLTCLVGLLCAAIAMFVTSWDWLTCLLVTAPGGSPEMIWIALSLDQNVELVTIGHVIRLIAINLALPFMVSFASRMETRFLSLKPQLTSLNFVKNTSN